MVVLSYPRLIQISDTSQNSLTSFAFWQPTINGYNASRAGVFSLRGSSYGDENDLAAGDYED